MDVFLILLKYTYFISEIFDAKQVHQYGEIFDFVRDLTRKFEFACIAGGFSTFLLGKTNAFHDVDIYLNCRLIKSKIRRRFKLKRELFCNMGKIFNYDILETLRLKEAVPYYDIPNHTFTIYKRVISGIKIQVICFHMDNIVNQEMYALKIINTFDLDICKNAIFLDLESEKFHFISTPSTKFILEHFGPHQRKQKYLDRINGHSFKTNPYSLKLICYLALLKNL